MNEVAFERGINKFQSMLQGLRFSRQTNRGTGKACAAPLKAPLAKIGEDVSMDWFLMSQRLVSTPVSTPESASPASSAADVAPQTLVAGVDAVLSEIVSQRDTDPLARLEDDDRNKHIAF